jgi:hypothetical protein
VKENKYPINIFDIEKSIALLPENLAIKIINVTNAEYLQIDRYFALDFAPKFIQPIYNNCITSKSSTLQITQALINKGYTPNIDIINELLEQKLDDNVIEKIDYLFSLGIKFAIKIPEDFLDKVEEQIFKDENIIANYAKYESLLCMIDDKFQKNLLNDLKVKISLRKEFKEFQKKELYKINEEFNNTEDKSTAYLKAIIKLHQLDVIANNENEDKLQLQFINNIDNQYIDIKNKLQKLSNKILNNTTITTLDLSWNNIGDDGAKAIIAAINSNKDSKITTLNLSGNNIGADGAKAIIDAINSNKDSKITIPDLSDNNIGAADVIALGKACAGKNITVQFSYNWKNNLFKLAQGTYEGTTLDLRGRDIGDDVVIVLGKDCAGKKITVEFGNDWKNNLFKLAQGTYEGTTLDLRGRDIGDDRVIVLGKDCVGKNIAVQFSYDGRNNLFKLAQGTFEGTTLYLSGNNIGTADVIVLGKACAGKKITVEFGNDWKNNLFKLAQGTYEGTTLNLSGNSIGDDVVIVLGKACAGKNITVIFGNDGQNNLFKLAQEYGNKEVKNSYFFNMPSIATRAFGESAIATIVTITILSILGSQGIIDFNSAAFIAPVASVGAVNLLTFVGFAITEIISKISDKLNIDKYNQVHETDGLAKTYSLAQILNPFHKVQFVEKIESGIPNNEIKI